MRKILQSVALCWHEREFFVCNYVYEASFGQWTFTWQSSTRILTTTWYFGAASAVMPALYRTVEDHCWLIYQFVYIRTLNCGPELWVVIEKTSLRLSSGECQGLALEIGWDLSSSSPYHPPRPGGNWEYSRCSLVSKGTYWSCSGIWSGFLQEASPWRCSIDVHLDEGPRGRPRTHWWGSIYQLSAAIYSNTLLNLLPPWSMETALQILSKHRRFRCSSFLFARMFWWI